MVQTVDDMIVAFKAMPTLELNVKQLLQLKLSLEEKITTIKELDGEILNLVDDAAIEDEIVQADALRREYTQLR